MGIMQEQHSANGRGGLRREQQRADETFEENWIYRLQQRSESACANRRSAVGGAYQRRFLHNDGVRPADIAENQADGDGRSTASSRQLEPEECGGREGGMPELVVVEEVAGAAP